MLLAWADMGAAGKALGADSLLGGPASGRAGRRGGRSGRSTMVARFDGPDVFEVVGRATGVTTAGWATHPVTRPGRAAGLAAWWRSAWPTATRWCPRPRTAMREGFGEQGADGDDAVASLEHDSASGCPTTSRVLLGDNLVVALDGASPTSSRSAPASRTDVAAAQAVLDKLEVARARHAAAEFARGTPGSRRRPGRRVDRTRRPTGWPRRRPGRCRPSGRALPDLDDADARAVGRPRRAVESVFGGRAAGPDPNLEPIDGIGVTVSSGQGDGRGAATYRFRLVAH